MEIEYSFEQKEKLVEQIQKLKKEQHFIDILEIITKHNPDINITENQNKKLMYFQNLKPITYIEIEKYIKKTTIKRFLSKSSDNTDTQNTHINSENLQDDMKKSSTDNEPFSDNPRLKYSNKEKNLIKRKKYDEQINNQELEFSESEKDNSLNESRNINEDDLKKIFVKRKTIKEKNKYNNMEADTTITLS